VRKAVNDDAWRESRKSYLWALSFLKPYKGKIALLTICSLFSVAGETLAPKVIQYMIDHVVQQQNVKLFWILLTALIAIHLIMLAAKNFRNILQLTIGELASRDILKAIFIQLRKLGFEHYERQPAGETLAMFNTEVANVSKIYRRFLPGILENFFFVTVSIGIMIGISGWMSLVIVPTFITYYLFGPWFERKAAHYGKQSGEGRVQFNQKVFEAVSGLREFRAYGAQPWFHGLVLAAHKRWAGVYRSAATYGFARGSFRQFSYYLGAIAVILIGVSLIRNGWITVGGFVAFMLLYLNAMYRLTMLVTQFTEQRLTVHQTYPLYQFMHREIHIREPEHPVRLEHVKGRITFDNVSFGYRDRPDVIRNFTLDIRPGEKVAFVGFSGSGKTTLMKLIGRFYDPAEGEIRLDGIPIRSLKLEDLRNAIGYVFQETYLFGSSVKDNIRFGKPDATDEEVIEAAKAAFAHDFITALPDGYDTIVGERGIKLSGGQRQRISIARMIIKQPAIVLLDEATSALDNVSEREVQRALDNVLAGRTVIAIAHRLSTVKHFDRIVFVKDGRVAEIGPYGELIARRGLLYELEQGEESA
jgi:ATP-binding cassette subfamily B protein/subfamily B ATP-binding cassette protein MsbA